MSRQRIDPVLATLARRRPDLGSAHFSVSCLNPQAGEETRDAAPSGRAARLAFSLPKRLLPRAVDRNALKRVGREAWRHARWNGATRPAAAMIRLRSVDPVWKATPRGALKKAWRSELDELIRRLAASLRRRQGSAPATPDRRSDAPDPRNPSRATP